MRRKDREMNRDFGLQVIDQAQYGVLSLPEGDGLAYGIPLSIAREGGTLYFHSAKSGKKTELIKDGAPVHITFVGECQVPCVMTESEAAEAARTPEQFGLLTSKLFTTEFSSAMVKGVIRCLSEDAEKTHALRVISQRFTPQWMGYFPQAIESGLKLTAVYAVDIKEITAKRKKFDAQGQEMKNQRMG
jgi:hypothetical protein